MTRTTRCMIAIPAVYVCLLAWWSMPARGADETERPGDSRPAPGSLRALIDLDGLPVLHDGARAGMFSSVDPRGQGNDHGNYLRVDDGEADGERQYVLADVKGPGVITRIWSANPQGRLKVYLDGAAQPVLNCPFKDVFEDKVPPFRPPITGKSSGGWYSYWPIGYARSCRITVSQDPEVTRQRAEDLKPHPISVPVNGARELKLVVTDGGNGFGLDHADWADARLVRADGSAVSLSDVTATSDDVRLVSTKQGFGELGHDKTVDGNPLTIDGKTYEKGLGSHGPAEHVYEVTGAFATFEAEVGLDDEARGKSPFWRGSIAFQVFVDGQKLADTGVIGYRDMEGELQPDALYYHVNYETLPEGTQIEPFSTTLTKEQEAEAEHVVASWNKPSSLSLAVPGDATTPSFDVTVPGGETRPISELKGAGRVERIMMRISSDDPRALRRGILKAYWDGEPTPAVWAPLADFFGNGFGDARFASLYVGMQDDGYYCQLPMPFGDGARLEIENGSTKPLRVAGLLVVRQTGEPGPDVGRLCTQWRHEIATEGVLYTILDAKGRGKYVGCNLSIQGVADISYLEGNDQFFVDGEAAPSMIGTGTEDFFNGGWYYNAGVFNLPLHGLVVKDEKGSFRTAQYRYQFPDAVEFARSLVVKIEHGTNNIHLDDDYSSLAFFYLEPPTTQLYEPPPAREMNFPRKLLVRPNKPNEGARGDEQAGVVELRGATFAEDLFDAARSNLPKALAFWSDISEGYRGTNLPLFAWWPNVRLTRDAQQTRPYRGDVILCRADKPGAALEVPLSPDTVGASRVFGKVWLVTGPGCGQVRVSIGETQVAPVADCYADEVAPGAMIEFGPVDLPQGARALRLDVVGRNEKAVGCSLGLYAAKVVPVLVEPAAWSVIGPFPFDPDGGEDAFKKAWPPEQETRLDAEYDGLGGKVKWRPMPDEAATTSDYQAIDFDRACNPNDKVTAYAATYVLSPTDREAELRVGSSDPITVGVNGQRLIDVYAFRRCEPDQNPAVVQLRRGANLLLVKTCDRDGEWLVRLRFVDKAGRPMHDLRFARQPGGTGASSATRGGAALSAAVSALFARAPAPGLIARATTPAMTASDE